MRGRGNVFWIAMAWLVFSLLSGAAAQASRGDRGGEGRGSSQDDWATHESSRGYGEDQSYRRGHTDSHSHRRGDIEIYLDLNGRSFSGRNSTFSIKHEIQRQNSRIELWRYELVEVYLQAEAVHRAVEVDLVMNGQVQDSAYVQRRPRRGGMDEVHLQSHTRHSRAGAWELDFWGGEVKLYGIWVTLSPAERRGTQPTPPRSPGRGQPPRRLTWQDFGLTKVEKLVGSEITFHPHSHRQAWEVVLRGETHWLDIQSVEITYANGQRETLWQLQGRLPAGQERRASLDGRRVQWIKVKAQSPVLSGSRGQIQLKLGVN